MMLRGGGCKNKGYHDTVLHGLIFVYITCFYTFNVCVQVMY